jgi:AcrR family transcriptional regulator
MRATAKLSAEERRAAIVHAVRRVFSEKGFHGTTTRELAQAADVSEALLFKHFPNKEALYAAMQLSCCSEQELGHYERIAAREPSARTLVLLVQFLVSRIVDGVGGREDLAIQHRLMLRSLAEDGEFARLLLDKLTTDWVPKVAECVRAAIAAKEAVDTGVAADLGAWFTHHVAALILFSTLPARPAVPYRTPRKQLVEPAVRFALRGLGLKDETIRRYYDPKH